MIRVAPILSLLQPLRTLSLKTSKDLISNNKWSIWKSCLTLWWQIHQKGITLIKMVIKTCTSSLGITQIWGLFIQKCISSSHNITKSWELRRITTKLTVLNLLNQIWNRKNTKFIWLTLIKRYSLITLEKIFHIVK